MDIMLQDDHHCFACGKENPHGLQLEFEPIPGGVRTFFTPLKCHQGYKDIIHGGILTTLLDETMAQAAIFSGHFAVTAEITVRFHSPLGIGEKVRVDAKIGAIRHGLMDAEATVHTVKDEKLIAQAKSKLLLPPKQAR